MIPVLLLPWAQAANFIWNNGSGNGRWNTTSANWSGSIWGNSSSNHAFFSTVGGSVSLRTAITAGSVNFGSIASNTPSVTLTGSFSLVSTSLNIQGMSTNGGAYASNPSFTLSGPTVSISGDIAVGRANLVVSSGAVTANRIITSAASADWARFVMSGGTVTATNGVDGSVNTSATFAMDLNGGTLRTASIRVADREVGINNNAWLTLNGGTVQATADNADFITLYGGNQNAYIGNGGAIIDTNGRSIGINVNLRTSGSGGLVKAGLGTLTLSGQNNYTGTTRVDGGVLALANSSALPASAAVEIASGARMHLGFSGNITLVSLLLNGVSQPAGVYSAVSHPGYFTGSGQLIIPPPFSNAFVWSNSAGTGLWSTTDANWSAATWVNSASSSASFPTIGGSISLSQAIIAGSVNFGSTASNASDSTFNGGSLTAASLTVQGNSANGGTYSGNPSLTLAVPTVAVSGDIAVGRANLVISSGTVTANRITTTSASSDWARFVMSGGTVTATSGVDGSLNGSITFAIDLNGGTLRTPSIRVADREAGTNNSAWLTFNGGTVQATADNADFITLYGGNQNAYIGNGGAVIDTAGYTVGINVNLRASGVGGLTKSGLGTLTLSGQNSYTGTTRVDDGVLALANPSALPAAGAVEIASGAKMNLGFSGTISIGSLRLNGVSQPEGVYSAATHPGYLSGAGRLVVLPPVTNALAGAATDGISNFRRLKYGFFVHYVWDGSGGGGTFNSDGSRLTSIDECANRFDAAGFASAMESIGVDYVIFTAWHANFFPLFNSSAMAKYYPGRCPTRDMIGDMVDAVRAKGIRVLFYTHPMQPMTWDYNVYNNLINDVYAELVERYGDRIDGLFLDENDPNGGQDSFVDYPRLRQTIKSRRPDLLMMQNYYGTIYSCDIGQAEYLNYTGTFNQPGGAWPAQTMPNALVMSAAWAPLASLGPNTVRFSAEDMYRYTVLQAGANIDGGGVTWAASPYADGVWETGVLPAMMQVGNYIRPIRRSICNTLPSQSWITPANATINSLPNGIVATRSPDDGTEFIHVLTPPSGNSLTVPAPADGRGYGSASLLENGNPVSLVRNSDGSLTLTLQNGDTWNPRDTVIALTPVAVTWNGNSNDAGPGLSAWSQAVDNFTGGAPLATRFRSGDNVSFSLQGAATALPWQSGFSVGDLRFSGKNYQIQPSGSPTLTLASGRIDVADDITASFLETGNGGPLTLAGSSGLTKSGGGTLVLDLPSQVTGSTILTSGVVAVRNGALGRQGNIVFNGGTLCMLPGNQEDYSSRIRHSQAPVRIDTGGNNVVWATPLDASNIGGLVKLGSGTFALAGGIAATNSVTIDAGALKLEPATTGGVSVPNAGFETPAYAPQGWSYNPSGTAWTFSATGGTASSNSPWVGTSPEGAQVAYLQNNGSMSTQVSVSSDGQYRLSFLAANRPNYLAGGLVVTLDGVQIGTYQPGHIGRRGNFNRFELPAFRLTAGAHTLTFQGLQNGSDSAVIIDDVRFTAAEAGALPSGASLALTGSAASFDPGQGTVTLDSLAGVAGSTVALTATNLAVTGNDHTATFAGSLTGTGSLTVNGTLRLVGDATLNFTGPLTNNGVLDIMTWNGTLPAGFVNNGIVLDRSKIRVNSVATSEASFTLKIDGFTGHNYQLQRSDDLSSPWQDFGPAQPGVGAELIFIDPNGSGALRRFYRVSVSP